MLDPSFPGSFSFARPATFPSFQQPAKVKVTKSSPLIFKVLNAANPFLKMAGSPKFQVIHAFRGSFTHGATRSASALAAAKLLTLVGMGTVHSPPS